MKIRSITCFFDAQNPLDAGELRRLGEFAASAKAAYEAAGVAVQTLRLATGPFSQTLRQLKNGSGLERQAVQFARDLEDAARQNGFEYISIGPVVPADPQGYALIPGVLAATQAIFTSGLMTTKGGGVSLRAVNACAQVIHRTAGITEDGFTNLRFAALANVTAGSPFFPAAYHRGGPPAFALATEAASLAVQAFTRARSVLAGRRELSAAIESHAQQLEKIASLLQSKHGLHFGGIDFSLAPFPEESDSLGTALERLGTPAVGLPGTLAAAAILTDAIDRARFQRAGFSGLMLPVLEDFTLAKRAAEGTLDVENLLLYSAVCGAGLDTVPLPGDTPASAMAALLLDLACLAQRLRKPLTARLMPIPGKTTGEPIQFDFSFFANSRVMALPARPLLGGLAGSQRFALRKLRR
jgi:uncharacterized protein (UPF0210 family)